MIREAGFELGLEPRISFIERPAAYGRPIVVPTALPRLTLEKSFARVELPLHVNWSHPGRLFNLRDRRERARVYEIVLREGQPSDILAYIDGALLIDLWNDLVLPPAVRMAWQHLIVAESSQQEVG